MPMAPKRVAYLYDIICRKKNVNFLFFPIEVLILRSKLEIAGQLTNVTQVYSPDKL